MVGVRVTREPEFNADDIALLMAHLELEARPRNAFGILIEEATDPANQFKYQANEAPLIDFAAAAVGKAQDAYNAVYKDRSRHGDIWYVKPPTT